MLKPFDLQALYIILCIKVALVTELAIGTEVDVYSSENGWTEIEWNRWHGYVKNEFVKQLGQ